MTELQELQQIRQRIDELEKQLQERANYKTQVFEVTLKVTTRPSTWGEEHVDAELMEAHFYDYMSEIMAAARLNDDGDEVKVIHVKEVT
jgi:hypothetical protein